MLSQINNDQAINDFNYFTNFRTNYYGVQSSGLAFRLNVHHYIPRGKRSVQEWLLSLGATHIGTNYYRILNTSYVAGRYPWFYIGSAWLSNIAPTGATKGFAGLEFVSRETFDAGGIATITGGSLTFAADQKTGAEPAFFTNSPPVSVIGTDIHNTDVVSALTVLNLDGWLIIDKTLYSP